MGKREGSRVMSLNHKTNMIWVREGHDGRVVLEIDNHREDFDGKFPAACRYAVKWLLENAGEMKGDYSR